MFSVDTNVLLRHVMQDDPVQSPKATHWIEHRLTEDDPGFVSLVTMAETAWVLERRYRLSVSGVAYVIQRILQTESLIVQSEQEVFFAMEIAKAGQGSFADALIGALGLREGCTATLTFDRKASRLDAFDLIT